MFTKVTVVALTAFAVQTLAMSLAGPLVGRDLSPNCARNYTVHLGDTCDAISASQQTSTFQLALVNPNIDAACDNLAVGEPLCLGNQGQDCTTVHKIVSGDSCVALADNAGIPLSTLLANNPNVNSDCSNIYPDEVLCVANRLIPYGSS